MRGLVDDLCSLAQHGKLASDRVAYPSMKDPEWWETQEWGNKGGRKLARMSLMTVIYFVDAFFERKGTCVCR